LADSFGRNNLADSFGDRAYCDFYWCTDILGNKTIERSEKVSTVSIKKMKTLLLGLFLLNALTFCSSKTEKINEEEKGGITEDEEKGEKLILGVWTDGSGPNASVRFEWDSIYDVEHFERTKYELAGDSLTIFYEDEAFKAKIKKLDADSLIYASMYGETKMWRFKD
jgi:hypothetical protein